MRGWIEKKDNYPSHYKDAWFPLSVHSFMNREAREELRRNPRVCTRRDMAAIDPGKEDENAAESGWWKESL